MWLVPKLFQTCKDMKDFQSAMNDLSVIIPQMLVKNKNEIIKPLILN